VKTASTITRGFISVTKSGTRMHCVRRSVMQLTFPRSSSSDGNDVPNQPEFDKRLRRDVISIVNSSQRQRFVFVKSTISAARPLMTAFTARRCTAEIRRRKTSPRLPPISW
jgi:hypothetical protein